MNETLNLWAQSLPQLLMATIKVTIPLSIIAFVLALVVAVIATAMRMGRIRILQWISRFYVWLFRGTPILVQLFIIFYGLPSVGIMLDAPSAGVHESTTATPLFHDIAQYLTQRYQIPLSKEPAPVQTLQVH